jgi:mono/diheme cytochrome c family protein
LEEVRVKGYALGVITAGLLTCVVNPASAASKGDPERGRQLYGEYCLQCHGGKGEGWGWSKKVPPPPIPIPDLSNPELMKRLSDQYLFDVIKGGGEAVGKTRLMPPAERVMSDQEIWDVIAFLRLLTQEVKGSETKGR